jgi:hypothetical protein
VYDPFFVTNMLRGVVAALADARLALVLAALALHLAGFVITGERWRAVLAALGSRLRLSRTVLINLAGTFVRNATPTTGLGGDAARIALLRADGVPLARATAAFAWVRLAEVPPIALVVALSAPAVAALAARSHTALTVVGSLLMAGLAAVWLVRNRIRARVRDVWVRTEHLRIDRAAAGLAVFYATLAQVEAVARQIVVAAAFGLPLTIEQSATITAMSIVGGFVPTIGSIGAIDGSLVAGLMLFGATADTAIAVTLVGRAISYGVSTAAGALALALLGGRRMLRAVSGHQTTSPVA